MNFFLSEEHKMIQEAARDFAQKAKAGVIERDTHMTYPTEGVKEMGELGFMGIMTSPDFGGSGLDTLSYVLVMEELSKIDASASVIMSAHNSLALFGIERYGSEAIKKKYLPQLASGETIGCFCLSEPEAGSDATSQKTTAIDCGDHYLLNGVKNWITNAGKAGVHVVIAQTDREKERHLRSGVDIFSQLSPILRSAGTSEVRLVLNAVWTRARPMRGTPCAGPRAVREPGAPRAVCVRRARFHM